MDAADVVFLIVGLVGNAGAAAWLAGAVMDETERFLEWERQRQLRAGPAVTAMPVMPPCRFDQARVTAPRPAGAAPARPAEPGTARAASRRRRQ